MIDLSALLLAFALLAAAPASPPPYATDHRLQTPDGRRGRSVLSSAPDSARLDAATGDSYLRFPEVKVTGGRVYRLRFRYLVARGTRGPCSARVAQYLDTPGAWKCLDSETVALKVVGRWTPVDELVRAEPGATTMALEVKIDSPDECGEMWIDCASLGPKGEPVTVGP